MEFMKFINDTRRDEGFLLKVVLIVLQVTGEDRAPGRLYEDIYVPNDLVKECDLPPRHELEKAFAAGFTN